MIAVPLSSPMAAWPRGRSEDRSLLLRLEELERRIGGRTLFTGANLVVRAGDRIGVVGPNGAGKTTLLATLIGDEPPDGGSLQQARGTRLGLLRQEIDPRTPHSVRAEASTALADLDALEEELRELEAEMGELGEADQDIPPSLSERYDQVGLRFEQGGGFERHARVAETLSGLGFDDESADRPLATFSGGWLMRVELAKLLLAQPDVLLLDEPTNHLDLPSIQFFESTLDRFPGAVLVVSHGGRRKKKSVFSPALFPIAISRAPRGRTRRSTRYARDRSPRRESVVRAGPVADRDRPTTLRRRCTAEWTHARIVSRRFFRSCARFERHGLLPNVQNEILGRVENGADRYLT